MSLDTQSTFDRFYQRWIATHDDYLRQLIAAQIDRRGENDLKKLINNVLKHYQRYYEEKSRIARSDVLSVFSPSWLTPFEKTFLWVGGWKPSLAFRVVTSSIEHREKQKEIIERIQSEIHAKERELSEDMAQLQEAMAQPPVLDTARKIGRQPNICNSSTETVKDSLRLLLEAADFLRIQTVRSIMEILSPIQTVQFLIAALQLQLRIRRWGLQKKPIRHT